MIRLANQFFMMASCIAKNGSTIIFWEDTWNLGVMKLQYPELYTYALNKKVSVQTFHQNDIQDLFWLPLSMAASNELNDLQMNLPLVTFNPDELDIWTYMWGNEIFSVQKAYLKIIGSVPESPWFQWMWKSCCRSRLKFFFWLVLRDRINTRNLLRTSSGMLYHPCTHKR